MEKWEEKYLIELLARIDSRLFDLCIIVVGVSAFTLLYLLIGIWR